MSEFTPTLHSGLPIPSDSTLLADPPGSIGELLSAQSCSGSKYKFGDLITSLAFPVLFYPITGFLLLSYLMTLVMESPDFSIRIIAALACLMSGIAYIRRRRRPSRVETFVGTSGIARRSFFQTGDSCESVDLVVTFPDTPEMRTTDVDIYSSLGYGGSSYLYRWLDHSGKDQLEIRGAYHRADTIDEDDHDFHFAVAARAAWHRFHLDRVLNEIEESGSCRFRVFDSDSLTVGVGWIEGCFGGESTRLTAEEISHFALDQGVVHIETSTGEWYRGGRVCRIAASRISNVDQFLHVAQTHGGLDLSPLET